MSVQQNIATLQVRIAKAEAERESWRVSGMQEKYLEAHSTVDALELQLDALRQEGLRSSARNDARFSDADSADPADDRARLMARFSITFDGRQYQYDRYRYDRLEDAVSYARLRRATPSSEDEGVAIPAVQTVQPPDGAQRELMQALSITYEDGVYHLGAYRYDRLGDAIDYARLLRRE